MDAIGSLEELKRLKSEAQEKYDGLRVNTRQLIISMGTCSVAAGARETLQAILTKIETDHLENTLIRQAGCLGLCALEPIVQVVIAGEPRVIYGRVTPEAAVRILMEHVLDGKIVEEYRVEDE